MTQGTEPALTGEARHNRPVAPTSVSEAARAYLSLPNAFDETAEEPQLDDVDGWEQWVKQRDEPVLQLFAPLQPPSEIMSHRPDEQGGVPIFVLRPGSLANDDESPLFIEFHGGALIQCGGDLSWMMSVPGAIGRPGETWIPDYRMPPRHPYPAALDDSLAVYKAALKIRDPNKIVVSGTSAGGNLAAALLLRARDEGLPMPAALVLLTPELDLTESGDSFRTNLGIDILSSLMSPNRLYADGHDLTDPYLSPLFGDVTGFPPTFLQTGTRDLFLSNTVRMHRKLLKAGVPVELHVFEAMPHGGFGGGAPEDEEVRRAARHFERAHLRSS